MEREFFAEILVTRPGIRLLHFYATPRTGQQWYAFHLKKSITVIALGILFTSQGKANPIIQCFEATYDRNIAYWARDLSQDQKVQLCAGAGSNAPITCFEATYDRNISYWARDLSIEQKIRLCAGATSNSPITCFEATYDQSVCYWARDLSQDQKVRLCAARRI